MHRHVARSVLACVSILPFLSLSWGQSDSGTITGTVKDTSAAVIARVKITVTDVRTNADVFNELLEVTEAAPLMHAQSAELGDVVEHRRWSSCP